MTLSERIHLAQELHDGIAQELVGLGYSLDLLLAAPHTPTQTRIDLRTLRFTVTDLVERVREEMHQLRRVDEDDLWRAIQESARTLCPALDLEIEMSDIHLPLSQEVAYQIMQISRELLRNIAQHSMAHTVHLAFSKSENFLELRIADDGIGGSLQNPARYGIVSARTRAKSIDGELTLESSDSGTSAILRVPL